MSIHNVVGDVDVACPLFLVTLTRDDMCVFDHLVTKSKALVGSERNRQTLTCSIESFATDMCERVDLTHPVVDQASMPRVSRIGRSTEVSRRITLCSPNYQWALPNIWICYNPLALFSRPLLETALMGNGKSHTLTGSNIGECSALIGTQC